MRQLSHERTGRSFVSGKKEENIIWGNLPELLTGRPDAQCKTETSRKTRQATNIDKMNTMGFSEDKTEDVQSGKLTYGNKKPELFRFEYFRPRLA